MPRLARSQSSKRWKDHALASWLLFATAMVFSPDVARAEPLDFQRDVWPILQSHCIACHGPEKQKSSLRVDSRQALLKGGDSGPAFVAGDPSKSYLMELVSAGEGDLRMPPEGAALAASQVDTLRRWIADGAIWPSDFTPSRAAAPHWAFQPVIKPMVPEIKASQEANSHNPIDAFLTAKLAERGLNMSPRADPRTLIRRLTLDLTGLPPTPDEVERFLQDNSQSSWEAAIDRLLASPRYGERWAQHWLDVIRYADTTGYESNAIRPSAWPYRDYVIAAFNDDIPYPRFLLEQLAGDTLGVDQATGFLVTPPFPSRIEVGQEASAIALARYNGLDEVLQNIGSSILGMTVGCARCHDHKFDPVTARDYYRLAANFAGLQFIDRPWLTGSPPTEEIQAAERRLVEIHHRLSKLPNWREVEPIRTTDFFEPVKAKWIRINIKNTFTGRGYAPAIDEVEIWSAETSGTPSRNVALAESGAVARSSGPDESLGTSDSCLNDGQIGRRSRWVARDRLDKERAWVEIELPQPMLIRSVRWTCDFDEQANDLVAAKWRTLKQWEIAVADQPEQWQTVVPADLQAESKAEADQRAALEKQFAAAATRHWQLTHVFAGRFLSPDKTHVLRRGNPLEPRDPTGPGGIDVLGAYELTPDCPEPERRLSLARWLGSEKHPLTARVLVNRVWRHHFGAGLVDTPSDFGAQGERPTHPELLDWLACEFIDRGWKLKELHKLICTSNAYQQSSRPVPEAAPIDADGRLLWRFPPRRLEAEAIRDCMLFVSGSLDLTMGGPGVSFYLPQAKPDGGQWIPKEKPGPETWRRTIYLLRARGADDGLFKPFDMPDCGQVRAKRSASTTPLQALNLFNSPFTAEQAQRLADRARSDTGDEIANQIDHVFALTLARPPTPTERAACIDAANSHGLPAVCRAIFNSNEFLFLE